MEAFHKHEIVNDGSYAAIWVGHSILLIFAPRPRFFESFTKKIE